MRGRSTLGSITLAASTCLLAAACGGDSDDGTAARPLCSGITRLDAIDSPGGPVDPTADEVKAYGAALSPAVDSVRTGLDGRLGPQLAALDGAVAAMSQGDIAAANDPGLSVALDSLRKTAAADCKYEQVAITAKDYGFEMPAKVSKGGLLTSLTNTGKEPHVFLLVRRDQPGGPSDQDLVASYLQSFEGGERPAGISDVNGGGPGAGPGEGASHVFDLSPGTYVYFCPIPSGEDGSGPPHFTLGMIGELTVTG
jgi:plastocyanin